MNNRMKMKLEAVEGRHKAVERAAVVELEAAEGQQKLVEPETVEGQDQSIVLETVDGHHKTIELKTEEGQHKPIKLETADGQNKPFELEADQGERKPSVEGQNKPIKLGALKSKHKPSESHSLLWMTQKELYENAAIYLEEGECYLPFKHHPTSRESVKVFKSVNGPLLNLIDLFAGLVLLTLALFEDPAVYQLPVTAIALIELFMLLCLLIHSFFYYRWKGLEGLKEKKILLKHVLILEMLVEALVVLAKQHHHLRIMRAFRPVLLLAGRYTKSIKTVMIEIRNSLLPVLDVMILLLVFVTTFSVLGFYLFSEGSQIDQYTGDLNNWYFEDLAASWTNLFILTTTANDPDVMMPAAKKRFWAPIFFMLFILIGNYFIGNLVIAVVFDNFKKNDMEKFGRQYRHRLRSLRLAFELVDQEGSNKMTFKTFNGIMAAYKPRENRQAVIAMFYFLKGEKDHLTLEEWLKLPTVLCCSWRRDDGDNPGLFFGTHKYPSKLKPLLQRLRRAVTSEVLEHLISVAILINAGFIIAETAIRTSKSSDHKINAYEEAFLTFYTIEVLSKIASLGFKHYLRSAYNRFDFVVVVVGLIGQIVETEVAFVAILRPFRLLRLLRLKKSFFYTLSAIFNLVPKMQRFLVTLVYVYFFFAIIGMESFSGLLSKCGCVARNDTGSVQCQPELFHNQQAYTFVMNSSSSDECDPSKRNCTMLLCETVPNCFVLRCGGHYDSYYDRSTADGLYYLNNFDNLLRSYVTLFELMVVNNWQVTMQGTVDAIRYLRPSGFEQLSRAYFITFYLLTAIIVMNVVSSFIISVFETLRPSLKERYQKTGIVRKKYRYLLKLFPCLQESEEETGQTNEFKVVIDKKEYFRMEKEKGDLLTETMPPEEIGSKVDCSDDPLYLLLGSRPINNLYIYEELFQDNLQKWKGEEAEKAAKRKRDTDPQKWALTPGIVTGATPYWGDRAGV